MVLGNSFVTFTIEIFLYKLFFLHYLTLLTAFYFLIIIVHFIQRASLFL